MRKEEAMMRDSGTENEGVRKREGRKHRSSMLPYSARDVKYKALV